jgi:2',3'-cyclic-nucleotide 2'-phosphodiesterase / 3'-nucleotidase
MPPTPHDHPTADPFRRPVDHDSSCCPSLGETLAEPDPIVESFGGSMAGRRGVLTGVAALAAAGLAAPAYADEDDLGARRGKKPHRLRVTVLGTTDLHGNVFNWDYFKNKEYDDTAHNDIGVAKVATLVKAMRKKFRKRGPVLLLDAGDTIQGTPLAYYYARIAPITTGGIHPMAAAMNTMRYDAAALGNHEFNYGIDTLRAFQSQLEHPLLGANVVDPATKRPVFPPYTIKKYKLGPGRTLKIGILGLVTPGVAIWDKANVQGKLEFPGLVEQAAKFVPELKKKGCDLVIVSAHSGADTSSSYGDALPYPENAASLVAEQVPDIDAILVGHAHKEIPQRFVTNTKTGKQVLLCEPYYWGMRLAVMNLSIVWQGRKRAWKVVRSHGQLLNSNTAAENPKVAKAVRAQHDKVVTYVNAPIGTSTKLLSAARSVVEDVPIIDFVQYVQAGAVKAALTGADASLPVLSEAAPFSRTASFPQGQVSVRDVAGLYIYDNTLLGVKITGADVQAYLEFSAAYFKKQNAAGPYTIAQLTNAVTTSAPNGTPDYNFDSIRGLDKHLTYRIDVGKDVGSRILDLKYDGAAIDPAAQFVLAVNNYRQSGGGGFPAVKTAPVVYNAQVEIRQLLIDWVTTNHTIDVDTPPTNFTADWKLAYNGADVVVS